MLNYRVRILRTVLRCKFIFTMLVCTGLYHFTTYASIAPIPAIVKSHLSLNDEKAQVTGSLSKVHLISIDLSSKEQAVLAVEQINADLRVRIFDTGYSENQLLKEISTPADYWLPEIVYLSKEMCTQCILEISPFEAIDENGTFSLSSISIGNNETARFESYKLHSEAGELWNVMSSDNTMLNEQLVAIRAIYQAAFDKSSNHDDTKLAELSLFRVACINYLMGDYSETMKQLDGLTSGTNTDYKIRIRAISLGAHLDTFSKSHIERAKAALKSLTNEKFLKSDLLMHTNVKYRLAQTYEAEGQFIIAKQLLEEATNEFIELSDMRRGVIGLTYLGWLEYRKGNPIQALNFLRQAEALSPHGTSKFKIDINIKLAKVHRNLGDFEKANYFIEKALKHSFKYPLEMFDGWAKQEKARILMYSGQFDLAVDSLFQAKKAYQNNHAKVDVNNIDYFLGDIYLQQGNLSLAKTYIERVLAFDKTSGGPYEIGTGYSKLARVLLHEGKYQEANRLQEKSLEYLSSVDDASELGQAIGQLAAIQVMNNDVEAAQNSFELALNKLSIAGNSTATLGVSYLYAEALAKRNQHSAAKQVIEHTLESLNTIGITIQRPDQKRSFLAITQQSVDLYIHLTSLLSPSADNTPALLQSQAFRAITLSDKLASLGSTHSLSNETSTEQIALLNQLHNNAVLLRSKDTPKERAGIASDIRKITAKLYKLDAKRYELSDAPMSEKASHAPFTLDSLTHIQTSLSKNDAILYFDTGQLSSHLWLIKNQDIKHYTLPSSSVISSSIKRYHSSLAQQIHSETEQKTMLGEISEMLLSQLNTAELNGLKKLVIVPNGTLNLLPFSALYLPKTNQSLLERFSIAYSPSLQMMSQSNISDAFNKEELSMLLVADPAMQTKESNTEIHAKLGFDLEELPYTALEAEDILEIKSLNTTQLSRERASKDHVITSLTEAFDIVHFATHGVSNSQLPAISGLVLSNYNNVDNLFMAPEIAGLNISPTLAVLSGCETTLGSLVDGEGFMGLSRAFFEAGAQNVIGSLWEVKDDATAKLMAKFYKLLIDEQLPPIDALQQAKLYIKHYRRKNGMRPWKDPYYWAGFVLQGNGSLLNG
ncbi:CHAT domain-containing protein [Agaribacter flavus]|uniref:CHAT domain-containing protein n=1 Tax=Agaribacter flavus TaxID=1902781 RepID=A0ABV7FLH1_9ALTE